VIAYQPSIIALVCGLWSGSEFKATLQFDLLFRLAKGVGAIVHEHAHLVTAVLICGTCHGILTPENCLGHVSLLDHALQLLPGMPCPHATYVTLPKCQGTWPACAVHLAGLTVSALLVIFSSLDWSSPLACAALFNLVMSVSSDFIVLWKKDWGLCPGTFGCGNWGLVIAAHELKGNKGHLFPSQAMQLLHKVLNIVELRGAQAGGVNLFVDGKCFGGPHGIRSVVVRVVKKKRAQLPQAILSKLWWKLARLQTRSAFGFKQPEIIVAQGHSRFGTSSAPALKETHPHQWVGTVTEKFWSFNVTKSLWECSIIPMCVTITHNGDFDEWKPYEEMVGVKELGHWLERVLAKKNAARGDSAKMAGVMDLLISKGSWFRSVRFAYTLFVLTHVEQITGWEPLSPDAPNKMPKEGIFRAWADAFEQVFRSYIDYHSPDKSYVAKPVWDPDFGPSDDVQSQIIIEDLAKLATSKLVDFMSSRTLESFDSFLSSESLRSAFISGVVRAFVQQDMLTATWQFFRRAHGTFGISVTCTAWPSSCVLAAKGQPMSVGFDETRSLALWASEPASLAAGWRTSALRPAASARWDLRDATGEIIEIQIGSKSMSCEQVNSTLIFPAVKAQFFEYPSLKNKNDLSPSEADALEHNTHCILLRGCTMAAHPVAFEEGTFGDRLVDLGFAGSDSPSKASAPPRSLFKRVAGCFTKANKPDPISADLAQIPRVLHRIDSSWLDPGSMNRESAEHFAQCVLNRIEIVRRGRPRAVSEIDVLVTGVESSHWIGQQFVADLVRVFPALHAVAISSNFVVGLLQGGAGRVEPMNFPVNCDTFKLAEGAVCLALSQSGTTYPTVWAARLLSCNPRCKVFAMSGHFDTVLAASVGQSLAEKVFHRTLFSTMAGIRPSEAATATSVAMHHTLSHLLQVCMRASVGKWHMNQGGRRLKIEDEKDYHKMIASLKDSAEKLCGCTKEGQPLEQEGPEVHKQLLKMGDLWAAHLTEGYWATFWGAVYVYITVTAGIPIVSAIWGVAKLPESVLWLPHFLDANIYVFLAALICLIHRMFTGRRLLTRFCARTLVIVDANTMNYKLLRAYISKLRALAYRFSTFSVLGQNGTDHFVHEMTHLTTSDVLIAVGRPDGRLAALSATEASMIMSLQQAKFIKKGSSGIEAFSLGHNPWTNPCLFTRHIALPTQDRPVFLSQNHLSRKGDGDEVNFEAACAPEEAVSRLMALYKGKKMGGNSIDEPYINFAELQSLAKGRTGLSRSEIRAWLASVVAKQARDLAIDEQDFRPMRVLPDVSKEVLAAGSDSESSDSSSSSGSAKSAGPKTGLKLAARMHEFVRGRSCYQEAQPGKEEDILALAEVMTVARGPAMKSEIQRAKKAKRRKQAMSLASSGGLITGLAYQTVSLEEAFLGWHAVAAEAHLQHQLQSGSVHAGDWRQKEAQRSSKHSQNTIAQIFRHAPSLHDMFAAWRTAAAHRHAHARMNAIGACWEHRAAPLNHVLEMQRLLEHLYETRVGATERLIGFLVLFHRMVNPISVLPFLNFTMDRTESRLRVASTPAPVAMRGELHADVTRGEKKAEATIEGMKAEATFGETTCDDLRSAAGGEYLDLVSEDTDDDTAAL